MGLLDKLANKAQAMNKPPGQSYGSGYPSGGSGYPQQQPGYGGGYPQSSSSPGPASSSSHSSSDDRPLPEGWIKQWDKSYGRYFYVDTKASPPRSIWVHPHDEKDSKGSSAGTDEKKFAPPSGPPPPSGNSRDTHRGHTRLKVATAEATHNNLTAADTHNRAMASRCTANSL
jgi:WW domain